MQKLQEANMSMSPTGFKPTIKSLGYNESPMRHYFTKVWRRNCSMPTPEAAYSPNQLKDSNFLCIKAGTVKKAWLAIAEKICGEWLLLTLLGIVVAVFSFIIDIIVEKCHLGRRMIFELLSFSIPLQYFVWILYSIVLVCFATTFTHLVGPFAVGSGIPEVKTIMQGVPMYEYLTSRTLIAKVFGLSTAIGSGLPIGKEGPFVHVASISATLLSKLLSFFKNEKKSRNFEILTAASAVGVACTFAAPIGGVLFSNEVTSTYFAVKNYWRGFYSAFIGAIFFRFLAIWFDEEVTLTAYFRTNFKQGVRYILPEIIPFSIVGIVCGFGGVFFIYVHKRIVMFVRNNQVTKKIIQTNRLIYPILVTTFVMTLFFPPGFGKYIGGMLSNPDAVQQLFSNFTWSKGETTCHEEALLLKSWRGPTGSVFFTLFLFFIIRFWMCAFATTLPIPAGIFIPSFTLGAGVGRLIGEILAVWFPDGIGGNPIMPGGYAIVGAAAFAGSVTHTVSTVVIAFEMTGQIGHVVPCIVATLISCVLSKVMSRSIFDAIVKIKKLQFLPGEIKDTENTRIVLAKDFMIQDVEYFTEVTTYKRLYEILAKHPYSTFPVVQSEDDKVLLGSIHRSDIEQFLIAKFGPDHEKVLNISKTYFKLKNAESKLVCSDFNEIQMKAHTSDWLNWQMDQTVDFRELSVDPAPFQLSNKTSLGKVHSMFSSLNLQHAFVTKDGRLVGIISVKEVLASLEQKTETES